MWTSNTPLTIEAFRREEDGEGGSVDLDTERKSEVDDIRRSRRPLLCAACGTGITSERHRVEIHGAHEHRFINPAGFLFDIGCFGEAPGCRAKGAPSAEFTWFAGYTWRFASCGRCDTHLGWLFEAATWSRFFALVLNRLVESEEEDGPNPL